MRKPVLPLCTVGIAALLSTATAQTYQLQPLTSFGPNGDGSLRPGDLTYLTTGSTERGMAYNPVTGHLLVVSRTDQSVHIIDGHTGTDLSALDASALTTGGNSSFTLNLLGIGDDGAIYGANLSNASFPPQHNLYRWQSETNLQQLIFDGNARDVSNGDAINSSGYQRYGDTIAVRGAGTNTQVLVASRGTNISLLMPIDDTLTNWNADSLASAAPAGGFGYGLAFGPTNTFYGTGGANSFGPLIRLSFDRGNGVHGTASVLQSFSSSVFPGTVSALAVDPARNLLAGLDTIAGADFVRLYDISDPTNPPVLLDRKSFSTANENGVFAGALAFGTNGVLYALDANNGIMAYILVVSNAAVAPSVFQQPNDRVVGPGATVTFTTAADGTAPLSYQWYLNGTNLVAGATTNSLTITNVQPVNAGAYSVVVTNVAGSATSSPAVLSVTTLIAYEPFNYVNDGLSITNQGPWVLTSANSSDHAEEGALGYPSLEPSRTNRLTWGSTSMSLRLPLGVTVNSGAIYYSFVLRVDDLGTTSIAGDTLAGFTTGTGTTFGTKLNLRTTGNGTYNLGTSRAGTSPIVWAPNEFSTSDIVFIVGRYTFVAGSANDVADIWINPSPSTFGSGTNPLPTISNSSGTDQTTIDRFFFRASGTVPPKKTVDELRIGLSWASVTPPAALLSIAAQGANLVLSWSTNASGYVSQKATALPQPVWNNVSAPIIVSGSNYTATVSADFASSFFRLIK